MAIGALGVLWLADAARARDWARRARASELDWNRHRPGHDSSGRLSRWRVTARFVVAGLGRRQWRERDGFRLIRPWRGLLGFALTLPVVGGGESALPRGPRAPPPRVQALRRTATPRFCSPSWRPSWETFLFVWLVPASGTGGLGHCAAGRAVAASCRPGGVCGTHRARPGARRGAGAAAGRSRGSERRRADCCIASLRKAPFLRA
jgi:hypothetical protein